MDVEAAISSIASASTNKNEKTTVDYFFNFCGSVAGLLPHFIILRRDKNLTIHCYYFTYIFVQIN